MSGLPVSSVASVAIEKFSWRKHGHSLTLAEWEMFGVSCNQAVGFTGESDFQEGFIGGIRKSGRQWVSCYTQSLYFNLVEQRLDLLRMKSEHWSGKNFVIFGEYSGVVAQA